MKQSINYFLVMFEQPLSEFDRKLLINLYMPIIGDKAITLYTTLATLVEYPQQETNLYPLDKILKLLNLKDEETLIKERIKVEAMGLMDTYEKVQTSDINEKQTITIYNLKKPLSPEDFFKDPCLSQLLRITLGHDYYETTVCDFLIRKWDLSTFKNITSSFDQVYQIENEDHDKDYSIIYLNNTNKGIVIDNTYFDINYYIVLLTALDILKEEILMSKEFIMLINRYSFFYQLTADEMKDATICAVNPQKEINYDDLQYNVKRIYDSKDKGVKVKAKSDVVVSSNTTIRILETKSPLEIVRNKYKTALTSAEIKMFDALLNDTQIGLGVLNVLIIYVLEEKNGEIPSYNYFLTIINRWKRAGVVTTQDAIDFINGKHASQQKKKTPNKKTNKVPEWYDDYVEGSQQQEKQEQQEKVTVLDDLEDFFKTKK